MRGNCTRYRRQSGKDATTTVHWGCLETPKNRSVRAHPPAKLYKYKDIFKFEKIRKFFFFFFLILISSAHFFYILC